MPLKLWNEHTDTNKLISNFIPPIYLRSAHTEGIGDQDAEEKCGEVGEN
jgi:hypothetical protein